MWGAAVGAVACAWCGRRRQLNPLDFCRWCEDRYRWEKWHRGLGLTARANVDVLPVERDERVRVNRPTPAPSQSVDECQAPPGGFKEV